MNRFIENGERFLISCLKENLAHSYDVIEKKFVKPYPEVTGYILKYFSENNILIDEMKKVADNIIGLQNRNGGWTSFNSKNRTYTFDTAQILGGLCEIYKKTNEQRYLNAAIKAGEYLISQQLCNGAFVPFYDIDKNEMIINQETYKVWNGPFSGLMCKLIEAYNALYNITSDEKYVKQKELTFSFYKNAKNIECTHPMGYFLEGLYAYNEKKVDLVRNKINKMILPRIEKNGYIAYENNLSYAYVSGTIQLGILMYKTGFIEEAKKVRNYGRLVQSKHDSGGLFQYADKNGNLDFHIHTEINSWGTKYFCELERLLENE